MITTKTENSITFHIETLERPDTLVKEEAFSQIAQHFSSKIEYIPNPDETLIAGGHHAFLYGLYLAYSEHRPFTLSPDMIWLLILQGIANHVNFSHQAGNNLFPQLKELRTITIENNKIKLGDPKSPWHETTEALSQEVEQIVGSEIVGELRADFSTTSTAAKVVSEITILDTFKPYFTYAVAVSVCGIPELKLEGSVGDWNRVLEKLEVLKKYDLEWWYDDLKPIISNIKNTAEASIDNEFWMQIFKVHTVENYGPPKQIDGWITKFFPYDRDGERINLSEVGGFTVEDIFKKLPTQVVSVDFKHVLRNLAGEVLETTPLEYWGGFMGVSQDSDTHFLKPEINWFISYPTSIFERYGDSDAKTDPYFPPSNKVHNLIVIPEEIFRVKEWHALELNFLGKVEIPERMAELKFNILIINGAIDEETIKRLCSYFDLTKRIIMINGEKYGHISGIID
jgi:hypothetical protein